MAKRIIKTIICTFCLERFTKSEIWWVNMIMHRADPTCVTTYSTASCGKCKDNTDNSWMIVGISEAPQSQKELNEKKEKNPIKKDKI